MLGSTTVQLVTTSGDHDPRATSISVDGVSGSEPRADLRRTSIELVVDSVAESRPQLSDSTDQGTVTIVFSDIKGSTACAQQLGDEEWFRVLFGPQRHHSTTRPGLQRA